MNEPIPYDVKINRYWFNQLFCWHGQGHRRIQPTSNGVVSYCAKCYRKHTGLHDFGSEAYKL